MVCQWCVTPDVFPERYMWLAFRRRSRVRWGLRVFPSVMQVEGFLEGKACVFAMFSSLQVDSKAAMVNLSIVCDFPDVFVEDICEMSVNNE